jgi:hypothetical protein
MVLLHDTRTPTLNIVSGKIIRCFTHDPLFQQRLMNHSDENLHLLMEHKY